MIGRSWWDERVLPRLVDVVLSESVSHRWRELVCAAATGRVLEVGFGSGHNLPHYPASVTEVLAVEPSDLAWDRARTRVESFDGLVRRIGLDGAKTRVLSARIPEPRKAGVKVEDDGSGAQKIAEFLASEKLV